MICFWNAPEVKRLIEHGFTAPTKVYKLQYIVDACQCIPLIHIPRSYLRMHALFSQRLYISAKQYVSCYYKVLGAYFAAYKSFFIFLKIFIDRYDSINTQECILCGGTLYVCGVTWLYIFEGWCTKKVQQKSSVHLIKIICYMYYWLTNSYQEKKYWSVYPPADHEYKHDKLNIMRIMVRGNSLQFTQFAASSTASYISYIHTSMF